VHRRAHTARILAASVPDDGESQHTAAAWTAMERSLPLISGCAEFEPYPVAQTTSHEREFRACPPEQDERALLPPTGKRDGFAVSVSNPAQAHHFARALLKRAKTDALDAQPRAQLACLLPAAPWSPPPAVYAELQQRLAQRDSLLDLRKPGAQATPCAQPVADRHHGGAHA
jgi:Transposase